MDQGQVELRIKALLGLYRRGLTITDLASRLKMNRNMLVKYLGVLETKGEVESYRFGTAKIFVLSHRLPDSALFDLATIPVCIIDERRMLTFANRHFFSFFGSSEGDALQHDIREITFDDAVIPGPGEILMDLPAGGKETRECTFTKKGRKLHFRIRMLPVIFGDGMRGTTFLFDDITKERRYLENLEFLARTSADLADMGDNDNIYQYIADRIAELEPRAHVNVDSIDPENRTSRIRAVSSADPRYLRVFGEAIRPLGNIFQVTMDMGKMPEAFDALMKGSLVEGPRSLYEMTFRALPEAICREIEEKVHLGRNYVMGCTCRGGLFGNVTLRFREGDAMQNTKTVEAFVKQAGVALQRRYLREKLARFEGPARG
jgi:PAS domain-containing protein